MAPDLASDVAHLCACSEETLIDLEYEIVDKLDYDIHFPTAYDYLCQVKRDQGMSEEEFAVHATLLLIYLAVTGLNSPYATLRELVTKWKVDAKEGTPLWYELTAALWNADIYGAVTRYFTKPKMKRNLSKVPPGIMNLIPH